MDCRLGHYQYIVYRDFTKQQVSSGQPGDAPANEPMVTGVCRRSTVGTCSKIYLCLFGCRRRVEDSHFVLSFLFIYFISLETEIEPLSLRVSKCYSGCADNKQQKKMKMTMPVFTDSLGKMQFVVTSKKVNRCLMNPEPSPK
jgi:hypothetical protein